ncbi:MAG: glycoside hydrolase family 9 protein [Acidobacteria bacterium]|nr:glycoside hydrolase family 9 protein [Acidobacteriota bacterium]
MKALALVLAACSALPAADNPPRLPLANDYTNSIKTRWLNKPVAERTLLDDAESLATWKLQNSGQAQGAMALTAERAVGGKSSIRLTSATTGDKPIPNARFYGGASAVRVVPGEDWSSWNRLSFWIYPDLPGFRVVSLMMQFHNAGKEAVPDSYGKMGKNYLILRNQQWNWVNWEIANLPRDKVTGVEFTYLLQGNEPGAATSVTFDIDKLELEKVQADHFLGWNVGPGEIAFSHSGYQTGAPKSAIASGLKERQFELINVETGIPALTKPITAVKTQIGAFDVMDFSEVREPGTYMLRAGAHTTRPFRIAGDVWRSSILKAINFFYAQRCGYAIPGVHDVCHRDWMLLHGDKKLPLNGGWHDAGDLSQSFGNTADSAYAMFSLAERLRARGEDPELFDKLVEEAQWGLDWLLNKTFDDGYRPTFCTLDRWTNGILGDVDDMVCQSGLNPASNLSAAATEALAARVLKARDPILAAYSLKRAIQDWGFAMKSLESPQRPMGTELAGRVILAGLDLYQATGDIQYAEKSQQFGRLIVESQQRAVLPELTQPLTGFFYTGPDKKRILRYSHASTEAAPLVALTRLCELFPNHADWIRWYAAVTLYAEYFQKPMAQFTQPYGMLANSIFHDEEYKEVRGGGRGTTPEAFREQVLNGVQVGPHHYVRLFPVWFEFRGNHGTVLSATKGLSAAAHLRGDFSLAALAGQQLQWAVGRNPFVQSTMWGEGYDYPPQYTAMSGDIVGALPVGIQSRGNTDLPYWPAENCHNWKEVWVVPVARWFWLMRDLSGPALVTGQVAGELRAPVQFRERNTGAVTSLDPDPATATFRGMLPEGEYDVSSGSAQRQVTLLPGGTYSLDFRPARHLDLRVAAQAGAAGRASLKVTLTGEGRHTLAVRADNLLLQRPERQIELKPGAPQTIVFEGTLADPNAPWVAVLVPDNDFTQRKEATGLLRAPAPAAQARP